MSQCSEAAGSDVSRGDHHESGHALVGMLAPVADPVRESLSSPAAKRSASRSARRRATATATAVTSCSPRIKVALGGRAAEKVVFGGLTTRAESVIQNLTQIARNMVGRWGQPPPSSANCWRL
jgi:cell division protease FtsH